VTAHGLGRPTLKTITHHSQRGQSAKSARCHHAQPHTEADNETYMQTYPQKSFHASCSGPMVSSSHVSLFHVFWPKVGRASRIGFNLSYMTELHTGWIAFLLPNQQHQRLKTEWR